MAAKCAAAADTLEQRANAMPVVQTEMIDVSALMREDYSRRVDHLHGEVDAAHRMNLYELRAANRLRTKTLDAEAHAAEVTAGQLRALASMCEKGLAIAHSASFMTYMESSLRALAGLVERDDEIGALLCGEAVDMEDVRSRLSMVCVNTIPSPAAIAAAMAACDVAKKCQGLILAQQMATMNAAVEPVLKHSVEVPIAYSEAGMHIIWRTGMREQNRIVAGAVKPAPSVLILSVMSIAGQKTHPCKLKPLKPWPS